MRVWGKSFLFSLAILALGSASAMAADDDDASGPITFTKDILPILQQNCQDCHRPAGRNLSGLVAPMALTTYQEVRPWVKSIVKVVQERSMPPWFASEEFNGVFELERHLTDAEIDKIARWAATGAPMGKAEDAPPPAIFPSPEGWTMGEPDLVIKMPEPYWVADDVIDIQPRFDVVLTEEQLPEDRWIQWIEFRPGSKVVHHGGASVTPLGPDGKPVNDPLCGGKIIGTAPGDGPDVWPVGYGKLIRKGSRISIGMHYHKEKGEGTGVWDQSMIAIKWHTEPVKYAVRAAGISSRGWEIPPFHPNWKVGAARTFAREAAIINMMPHMHFRGKSAKYVAIYPDGTREVLLDVPKYDYGWQLTYTYKEPKIIPAGTRVEVSMVFDNSKDNPHVPDPERAVGFGGMTDDEMNIGWLEFADTITVDELAKLDLSGEDLGETSE